MLSPYRVVDLTDERGEIAGMVLGDLGADVVRVEPPGGSRARQSGPLLADAPAGEQGLPFFAFNRNKRSIVLDLGQARDREDFLQLIAGADFVIDSGPGGLLEAAGVSFEALREVQPRIVCVYVTPFGLDGPYAEHPASDLTIAALGGPVSLQGVAERAPLRVSVPQVWRHAGAEAAVAALVAHARMRKTGEAQLVDVSAQCAMTWTMLNAMSAAGIQGRDFERMGSMLQLGRVVLPLVFSCADGHVVAIPNGPLMGKLVGWMIEDGIVEASWAEEDWSTFEQRMLTGQELPLDPAQILGAMQRFLAQYGKQELFERALAAGATIAPVNTIADLLGFAHLDARDFWAKLALPNGASARTPGAFVRSQGGPLPIRRPAPALDQHGAELRAELRTRPRSPAPDTSAVAPGTLPFAGLKVADFSWIGVGPISARYLADHGADVVRVESESRPDNLRGVGPFKDGEPGWNRSHFFAELNASKRGLTLDLKQPAARDVARRLLAWADVCIESFTPGTMERLGLGYEAARAANPRIVMMSTCLMGQYGPAAGMAGYGYHAGAVAGFYEVTGWPDLPPDGPWMAYTDTIAPRFVAASLIAAVDRQRRTGEGCHLDGAQLEMGLQFLAPELLDYQLQGHQAGRLGNRARDAAPQGVYACAGEDQWCAIAVDDDAQWRALRALLGEPGWAADSALDSVDGRLAAHDLLDRRLSAWARPQGARELMAQLLEAGVPAGVVQRSSDLLGDPQYAHRGFYRTLEHGEMGPCPYAGQQFRIRGYDGAARRPGPLLGEHSFEVLEELGYETDAIAELVAAGVIS